MIIRLLVWSMDLGREGEIRDKFEVGKRVRDIDFIIKFYGYFVRYVWIREKLYFEVVGVGVRFFFLFFRFVVCFVFFSVLWIFRGKI